MKQGLPSTSKTHGIIRPARLIWCLSTKAENSVAGRIKKGSYDTLLRCMLKIATYYQLLDKVLFIKSYKDILGDLEEKCIRKSVLLYKDQSQHKEIKEMIAGERPNLKEPA